MSIAKYAISKGMNREEFEALYDHLESISNSIMELIPTLHKIDTGVYHDVSEIFHLIDNDDYIPFIIMDLKAKFVEFKEDYTIYRF